MVREGIPHSLRWSTCVLAYLHWLWITWFIPSWEENNCFVELSKFTKCNYFHSKWHLTLIPLINVEVGINVEGCQKFQNQLTWRGKTYLILCRLCSDFRGICEFHNRKWDTRYWIVKKWHVIYGFFSNFNKRGGGIFVLWRMEFFKIGKRGLHVY